jgi:ribosomal protein S18 acetylase RimI-like enzyme
MEKSLEGTINEACVEMKGKHLPLEIEPCTGADIELLADLNRQLIEDEEYDVNLSLDKLKDRMSGFLENGYKAFLFKENNKVRGYALIDFKREPLYLRHYFICRDCRRLGYGTACLKLLLSELGTDKLDIEVMFWNARGYGFWKSFGFKERSIYMRLG